MLVYQRVGLGGVNLKICPLQCLNSRFEIGLERWLGLFFFCEPHSWFLFRSRNPVSSTGHSRLLMYYEFKTFVVLNLWTSMQLIDWPFRVVDKACWSSWSFEMDKKRNLKLCSYKMCYILVYLSPAIRSFGYVAFVAHEVLFHDCGFQARASAFI